MEKKGNSLNERLFNERKGAEAFRQALDYGLAYQAQLATRRVFPDREALKGLHQFIEPMPAKGVGIAEILEMLHRYGAPATVASNGGRYFGFVTGAALPAATAVSQMTAFWDQNGAMEVMSPVVARLEQVTEDWLKHLFGLPEQVVAGFVSGTSVANLCALAAARYRILENQGWDVGLKGVFQAPPVRVVCGEHVHASVIKALQILGFGTEKLERIPVDNQGRIRPDEVPTLDEGTILILQAGNVNSGAFDSFDEIIPAAKQAGAWVHIDGAFGLWAAVSPQLAQLCKGMEKADSWSVDGHKTLNTPYDSGIVLCADPVALQKSLQSSGAYLMKGDERDGMAYSPEMSRRSRVLELWACLKSLGKAGVAELIENFHLQASSLAQKIGSIKGLSVLNEVVFNQILVSCENDDLTLNTMKFLQEEGRCWAGGSSWFGKKVIRISICAWATGEDDIRITYESLDRAFAKASGES